LNCKFIILERDLVPPIKLREWPELVGMDGEEAVNIIKQETGKFSMIYTNNMIELLSYRFYTSLCSHG
jgi:hypothetical protein